MARSLNKVQLIGNLGADPDVRTTGSGVKVAQFSVATSRQWKDREGQDQERTEWHRVVVWGFNAEKDGLAGVAERYLQKGARVYVEGAMEYRSYEDKEGITRHTAEVRCTELIMLGDPQGGAQGGGQQRGGGGGQRSGGGRSSGGGGSNRGGGYDDFQQPDMGGMMDDDLPF